MRRMVMGCMTWWATSGSGVGIGMGPMRPVHKPIPRELLRARFGSIAAGRGSTMPSTAAWPTATGAARRTGTTAGGSARPEDFSFQQPAMKQQLDKNRSGASRPERKGAAWGEVSPSPPAPEPRRMIAGARLCRWWSLPLLGGPHKDRGGYAFPPQFEQTLASTTIGTSG